MSSKCPFSTYHIIVYLCTFFKRFELFFTNFFSWKHLKAKYSIRRMEKCLSIYLLRSTISSIVCLPQSGLKMETITQKKGYRSSGFYLSGCSIRKKKFKNTSETNIVLTSCTLFSNFGPLWSMSIIWVPSLFYWFCECFEDTFLLSIDWMMVLVTDTGSPFGAKILRWSSGLLNSYSGRKILL